MMYAESGGGGAGLYAVRWRFSSFSIAALMEEAAHRLDIGRGVDLPLARLEEARSTTPAEPTIPRLFDGSVDAAPLFPRRRLLGDVIPYIAGALNPHPPLCANLAIALFQIGNERGWQWLPQF
jgi:hypothetical protein